MIDNSNDIAVYLHFPFCKNICSYCDFVVNDKLNLIDNYIKYLIKDIEITSKNYLNKKNKIKTIYFGGGTPSLMSPSQLEKIVNSLHKNLELSHLVEFSIESNPASIDYEKLKEYKDLGVNRISIGVQSFNKRELGILKRNHSPNVAINAINDAKKVGFNSVNLDLIFSVPNQTLENWMFNLEMAVKLETDHISCYNLTYEKNTPLYNKLISGKITKNDEEFDSNTYLITAEYLEKNGFNHYEVSNYSKKNMECLHNLMIWQNHDYLGFGLGSHWKINGIRYENTKNMKEYFQSIEKGEIAKNTTKLTTQNIIEEYIILGLRANGVNFKELYELYNINLNIEENPIINRLIKDGYVLLENLNLKLTNKGYLFADSITYEMLKIFKII